MTPLVSIITPCYNSGNHISETMQSVLNQTYQNWEWWIVDDGSSDNSVDLIQSIQDPRIHLIALEKNVGAAEARNVGIRNAKGRFLTFIDSDDVWLKPFLETTVYFLIENKEELVYASYKRFDEEMKPLLADFIAEDNITYNRILYNCPIPMLTSMYDTQRIGKIEIPEVDMREDYAMWIEILKKIPKARAIVEPLAIYRIRETSYSRNKGVILKKQFLVYYNFLNLSLLKSIYYTLHWALNGMKKYEKLTFRTNR
ncbi:MAG: glycosyltransferase [Weeksellaceae bacterium]